MEELLDDAVVAAPELERYRGLCETASAVHLAGRYPGVVPEPMDEELSSLLAEAEARVRDVQGALPA